MFKNCFKSYNARRYYSRTLILFLIYSHFTNLKAQWVYTGSGINDTIVYVMEYNHPNTKIFAGTLSAGVYSSSNNGNTWTQSSVGITNDSIVSFAKNDSLLFAGTHGGLFRSNDDGVSWQLVNQNFTNYNILSILPKGNELFIGTDGNGVFYSPDLGNTWSAINSGLPQNGLNVTAIISFGGNLFIGTVYGGVFKSTNNGSTWAAVNNGLGCTTYIRSFQMVGNKLLVGTQGCGIYSTTDMGNSWFSSSVGLTAQTIIKMIQSNGTIYAATFGGGVCFSSDSGLTWSPKNSGLNSGYELAVNTIASDGYNFFVGTYGAGAYRLQQSTTEIKSYLEIEKSIGVNPNPASEKIHIKTEVPVGLVQCTDIRGKLIFQINDSSCINISSLENGIYKLIIHDKDGNVMSIKQIIKN